MPKYTLKELHFLAGWGTPWDSSKGAGPSGWEIWASLLRLLPPHLTPDKQKIIMNTTCWTMFSFSNIVTVVYFSWSRAAQPHNKYQQADIINKNSIHHEAWQWQHHALAVLLCSRHWENRKYCQIQDNLGYMIFNKTITPNKQQSYSEIAQREKEGHWGAPSSKTRSDSYYNLMVNIKEDWFQSHLTKLELVRESWLTRCASLSETCPVRLRAASDASNVTCGTYLSNHSCYLFLY